MSEFAGTEKQESAKRATDAAERAAKVWEDFDQLVSHDVTPENPWETNGDTVTYKSDQDLLQQLLAVPLHHEVDWQSGLPAKSVDVWLAHELRRAGFEHEDVWPRANAPRVMPHDVSEFVKQLTKDLRLPVQARIDEGRIKGGVLPTDAKILGKHYEKQVDVVMARWSRGPELMISGKRMGSSLSNNALNRVEESYGDAHNLRGRFPLAAIGYVIVVRSSAIEESPVPAQRLFDLVAKLGRDSMGYDATAVVVPHWEDDLPGDRPIVTLREDLGVPAELHINRFLETMVKAVVSRVPINTHPSAERKLREVEMQTGNGTVIPVVPTR